MALSAEEIKKSYPIPVFYYRVEIDDMPPMAFSEVSGLSIEVETITYKDGLSYKQGAKHMPGMGTPVNLTLQKGIVKGDSALFDWINSIQLNAVQKRNITISLLNMEGEEGSPLVSWHVTDAFPTKLDVPSFNASSNEVAIESMSLMANGLTIIHES